MPDVDPVAMCDGCMEIVNLSFTSESFPLFDWYFQSRWMIPIIITDDSID